MVNGIWYMVIRYMVYGIRYMVYGIWFNLCIRDDLCKVLIYLIKIKTLERVQCFSWRNY